MDDKNYFDILNNNRLQLSVHLHWLLYFPLNLPL